MRRADTHEPFTRYETCIRSGLLDRLPGIYYLIRASLPRSASSKFLDSDLHSDVQTARTLLPLSWGT